MPHAQYKRLSPATFDPPVHLAEHTHEKQLATSQASQIRSKKRSLGHSTASGLPAAFWDNLSRIWLTKQALRELDRRNNQAAPNPPYPPHRRIRRPVTPILATKYLRLCTPSILKDIKLLARHGGPDLSDLRNVRIARPLPACVKADDLYSAPKLYVIRSTRWNRAGRAPRVAY